MTPDRRDSNEAEICQYLRQMGCVVVKQDRHAGFDLLVIANNGLHIVEVKSPASRNRLTQAEKDMRSAVWGLWKGYHVITSIEEAAELIGLGVEK